eukprot:403344499
MKATCAILMTVATMLVATSTAHPFSVFQLHPIDINNATTDDFNYYVHGLQGFWQGYMQGLYNTNKPTHITDKCLSPEISAKLANLAYVFHTQDMLLIFDVMKDVMAIVANFDECGLEKSIEEVAKYCEKSHDCEAEALFGGLAGKAFQLIDKATAIADIAREFPGETEQDVFEQGTTFGKAIGAALRIIFNFQHKQQ